MNTAFLHALEEELFQTALRVASDIRDDRSTVHRALRHMDRLELEQLCCVLAAMVDLSRPVSAMAWWADLDEDVG